MRSETETIHDLEEQISQLESECNELRRKLTAIADLEADNAHLRKSIRGWADVISITGRHRSCDCPACKRLLEEAINCDP